MIDSRGSPLSLQGILWCGRAKVSRTRALLQRFLTYPAILFERILQEILPNLRVRWSARHKRKTNCSYCSFGQRSLSQTLLNPCLYEDVISIKQEIYVHRYNDFFNT